MRFFDKKGCLQCGKQKLTFYFNRPADTNVIPSKNVTPSDLADPYLKWDYVFQMEKKLESLRRNLSHAEHQRKKQQEWLDRLLALRIESTIKRPVGESSGTLAGIASPELFWGRTEEELDVLHFCFLVVELPNYPHPVRRTLSAMHSIHSIHSHLLLTCLRCDRLRSCMRSVTTRW